MQTIHPHVDEYKFGVNNSHVHGYNLQHIGTDVR